MSFGPSGPYLKLKFVVIFQPIRELEFQGRLSDFFLSPQFAIKDQVCIQLSLLCETMTYFKYRSGFLKRERKWELKPAQNFLKN